MGGGGGKSVAPLSDQGGWWCEGDLGSRLFGKITGSVRRVVPVQEEEGIRAECIQYETFAEAEGGKELPGTEDDWELRAVWKELKQKGRYADRVCRLTPVYGGCVYTQ